MQAQSKLVKYCSVATGKSVLESQNLRWSSPHLFGDPFELDHRSIVCFDRESLLPTAIKVANGLIFSRESPKGNTPLINAIRRWRGEERFASPEEAEIVLRELLEKMVDARFEVIDELMGSWLDYIKNLRICCFCSKAENPLAWQKYADNHRGIAIQFNVEDSTSLEKPKPIEYTNAFPELISMKEQLSALIYSIKDKTAERFYTVNNFKPQFLKAEQEWRCFRKSDNDHISDKQEEWFDDIRFEQADVNSIFLGMNISETDKNDLVSLAKNKFNKARIYQIIRTKGTFNLEAVKL